METTINIFNIKYILFITLFFIIFIFFFATLNSAQSKEFFSSRQISISKNNSKLTLHLENTSLINILDVIHENTGIIFESYVNVDQHITAKYANIAIEKALQRLLSKFNYVFFYQHSEVQGKSANSVYRVVIFSENNSTNSQRIEFVQRNLTPTISPNISKGLLDIDSEVREETISNLTLPLQLRALDYLYQIILQDEDEFVRAAAAEQLGKSKEEKNLPYLFKAFYDEDDWVRENVVEALSRFGTTETISYIYMALEDSNPAVKRIAQKYIDEMK